MRCLRSANENLLPNSGERQSKVIEDRLCAVVNETLKHLGALTHCVHRAEVLAEEIQQFEPVVFDHNVGASVDFHSGNRRYLRATELIESYITGGHYQSLQIQ